MVKTDEYTLAMNWVKYNKKLAKLVKEQQEQENRKIANNVRVADLKAVWNKEFKDRGGIEDD